MSMCDICIPNTCWSIRWVLIRWWFAVQQTLVRPQLRITTRTCSSFEATRVLPTFILENSCVSIATSLFATGLHNIRKPTKCKWVISTRPINGGNVTSAIASNPGNAATLRVRNCRRKISTSVPRQVKATLPSVWQGTNQHITKLDVPRMALQSDVPLAQTRVCRRDGIGRHQLTVERHLDRGGGGLDLIRIPLASRFGCNVR